MAHGLLSTPEQTYYDNSDNFGNYQFISIGDVIDNFMATYVGEGKILSNTGRNDVSFHAHRALQELSFDTFKSCKSQEIEVPNSLTIPLPQDYVNYVKLAWVDGSGIEHIIYPISKTSNPKALLQNSDGDYKLTAVGTLTTGSDSITLDAEYTNIWVGMNVSSPNIPNGSTVEAVSTTSNITTITISTSSGVTYTGTETLTFTTLNRDLLQQEEKSVVLTGLSWTSGEDKITAASTADADTVKVGMSVSHEDFTTNTTIIDVNGAVITTSTNATDTGSSENANFISYEPISDTWDRYKASSPNETTTQDFKYNTTDDRRTFDVGQRYGLDPEHAHANGSYFIDCRLGKIHFSSNLSGKTVVLRYISDGVGTDAEMQVHKFAEEAMYKWIAYGCLSAIIGIPEYVVRRYKKERFAETRKAKLRLSNIKLEEITQIFRGKSKQIKH